MSNTVFSFPTMRRDHQTWQAEHAGALIDNERCQAEHEAALETLTQIEQCLRHESTIEEHIRATIAYGEVMAAHERAMHDYERCGEQAGFQESLVGSHRKLAAQHANQQRAHERIKRYHDKVMARVVALKEAIEEEF